MTSRTHPGERFSRELDLTADAIVSFARASGDTNPVHHDSEHAAATRFGGLIASGAQTSSLLMGFTAAHFSQTGDMLGLDFQFQFKRPVHAEQTIRLDWLVIRVRPSARLEGELVELRGRLVDASGQTAVGARGKVLLVERL